MAQPKPTQAGCRIINLDRYPLHHLNDAQYQNLVTQCQQNLDRNSASLLHDFLRHNSGFRVILLLSELVRRIKEE